MYHSIRLLTASLVVLGLLAIAPGPAEAHTEACVGTGTMTLSSTWAPGTDGLGWTAPGPAWAEFVFTYTVGMCSTSTSLTASGVIVGTCGLSDGSGTANGHPFSFQNIGTVLVATGGFSGLFSLVEDPMDSGSCVNNTSQNFLLTGAAVAS